MLCKNFTESVRGLLSIDRKCKLIIEKQSMMDTSLKELRTYVEEETKKSYTITGDDKVQYEVNMSHTIALTSSKCT